MTTAAVPHIECEQCHATLLVDDVVATVDYYVSKLGFSRGFTWGDPPQLAGVNLGGVSLHLAQGKRNPSGCSVYFVIGNADELYDFQRSHQVEFVSPPEDRSYGFRDYRVCDLNGYELGFGHRLPEPKPALSIERVDVHVRLEKRLAALLQDLAEHKRISLNGCLEEIILHTFESLGDGVASPHTKRTLEHIRELKQKHGIDYDAHASYRFVER